MNAVDLIGLANRHGINLPYVAGLASETRGAARLRPRTPAERQNGTEVRVAVRGAERRSRRAPIWSHAELGIASCGLDRMGWLAVQYSIGGNCDDYAELHRGLMAVELRLAQRERWPWTVVKTSGRRTWYVAELAALVLDADAHRPIFAAAPRLFAVYLDISPETWEGSVAPLYRSLANEHERWVERGKSWIQRRIALGA